MRSELAHGLEFPNEECSEARLLVDARDYYRAFYLSAQRAENSLFIAGWQFDSEVELLRGNDRDAVNSPVRFIEFLNHLCEEKESLNIYILAWDYSAIYAVEREWFQGLKLRLKVHERVHFCYWTHPEPGGSFHQKYVVVDNQTAFLGGLDICDSRYDDREHRLDNSLRVDVDGNPCKPFHDLQFALRGPVVARLAEMFSQLWREANSAEIELDRQRSSKSLAHGFCFEEGLPVRSSRVALSRTIFHPEGTEDKAPDGAHQKTSVFEVRDLLCAAIDAAEELIYLENQYFTSKDVLLAFTKRLENPHRPKLKILMVMPQGADSAKEDFALGSRQRAVRHAVAQLAEHHGHSMRLLKSIQAGADGPVATFIHAKLMIVDDSFLTCGSANLTNRSMHVDFELNASFQADDSDASEPLRTDIRRIRASLLAEHAGSTDVEAFESRETLMAKVDEACSDPTSRLECQPVEEAEEDDPLLVALFDPNGPTTLETLEDPLKHAFDIDDTLVKDTVRRFGQRLGVFDIDE